MFFRNGSIRVNLGPFEFHNFGLVPCMESRFNPVIHRVKNGPFVDKAHFKLCGMNIDIHRSKGQMKVSTQAGNFPAMMEPLYASSKAAIAVLLRIYRPLIKKFCMLRLGRLEVGALIKPSTVTCPSS